MLKSRDRNGLILVTQPSHAALSGVLAAHWGNDAFVRPGHHGQTPDPDRLSREVVFAVAEHDNGWWEWEADPPCSEADGLPLDLTEVVKDMTAGMTSWRRGVPRFRETHPYASMLISYHAYWLYAPRCTHESDRRFAHPLFGRDGPEPFRGEDRDVARAFVSELEEIQHALMASVRADPGTASWLDAEHLLPHVRLVQVLDALSLSLCSGLAAVGPDASVEPGRAAFDVENVPRRGWDDLVTIDVRPREGGRIAIDPYPFDADPLPFSVPLWRAPTGRGREKPGVPWWYGLCIDLNNFVFCS